MKKFLYLGLSVILTLLLAIVLSFSTYDPQKVTSSSFKYHLGIPENIKNITVYDDCERARYSFTGRDGERAAFAKISFGSSYTLSELESKYTKAFESIGCNAADLGSFSCNNNAYSIAFDKKEKCMHVDIEIVVF